MNTIKEWSVIELNHFVINGKIDDRNMYTDKLLLIKDGYAVTERAIYKLGNPDKIWITTERAFNVLKDFQ